MNFAAELRAKLEAAEAQRLPGDRLDAYRETFEWANDEEPGDLPSADRNIVQNLRGAHLHRIFELSQREYLKDRDLVFNFLLLIRAFRESELHDERNRNPKCVELNR